MNENLSKNSSVKEYANWILAKLKQTRGIINKNDSSKPLFVYKNTTKL